MLVQVAVEVGTAVALAAVPERIPVAHETAEALGSRQGHVEPSGTVLFPAEEAHVAAVVAPAGAFSVAP